MHGHRRGRPVASAGDGAAAEAVEIPALGGVDEPHPRPTPPALLWLRDLGIVGGTAALIAAVLFRVWSWPLSVPFTYQGDSIGMMAFVKMVDQTGWYTGTARAGAPFGLNTYDWPYGGDNGWWVITKVITWFTDNAATATNLLFLLGFVLVALSAFVGLRMVGTSRLVSGALALVYAFAPWHFLRTTGQLFIGAPVSVPLVAALAVLILRGETPFFQSRRAVVGTVAICGVLAVFDPYFTVFGILIVLAAGALRRRRHAEVETNGVGCPRHRGDRRRAGAEPAAVAALPPQPRPQPRSCGSARSRISTATPCGRSSCSRRCPSTASRRSPTCRRSSPGPASRASRTSTSAWSPSSGWRSPSVSLARVGGGPARRPCT